MFYETFISRQVPCRLKWYWCRCVAIYMSRRHFPTSFPQWLSRPICNCLVKRINQSGITLSHIQPLCEIDFQRSNHHLKDRFDLWACQKPLHSFVNQRDKTEPFITAEQPEIPIIRVHRCCVTLKRKAAATCGTFLFALATQNNAGNTTFSCYRDCETRMLPGEVLEQNRWDNVAKRSSNWSFWNVLQILDTWLQGHPPLSSVAGQLWWCRVASASRKLQV